MNNVQTNPWLKLLLDQVGNDQSFKQNMEIVLKTMSISNNDVFTAYKAYIEYNELNLKYVDFKKLFQRNLLTKEQIFNLCLQAVANNGSAIEYIPYELLAHHQPLSDQREYENAVYQLCIEAVKQDGKSMKYISAYAIYANDILTTKQILDITSLAIETNPQSMKYLFHESGFNIASCSDLDDNDVLKIKQMCSYAANKGYNIFKHCPYEFITDDSQIDAGINNEDALNYIEEDELKNAALLVRYFTHKIPVGQDHKKAMKDVVDKFNESVIGLVKNNLPELVIFKILNEAIPGFKKAAEILKERGKINLVNSKIEAISNTVNKVLLKRPVAERAPGYQKKQSEYKELQRASYRNAVAIISNTPTNTPTARGKNEARYKPLSGNKRHLNDTQIIVSEGGPIYKRLYLNDTKVITSEGGPRYKYVQKEQEQNSPLSPMQSL